MSGAEFHILAVDDEPMNLDIIEHTLQKMGHTITTATNGKQAIALLLSEPSMYDVVLLDRMMPGIDGIETLYRIKNYPEFHTLPVILQTASSAQSQIEEGMRAGAFYYLCKPFSPQSLMHVMERALENLRRTRARTHALSHGGMETDLVSLQECDISVRTLEDALQATLYLSHLFPNPDHVMVGISELLINAIEHGNLAIDYDLKTDLIRRGEWQQEVERRLHDPLYAHRKVWVTYRKSADKAELFIQDEGKGFDWGAHLTPDPHRALDGHGNGIAVMCRSNFDELEYYPPGNKVRAAVRLGHSYATATDTLKAPW